MKNASGDAAIALYELYAANPTAYGYYAAGSSFTMPTLSSGDTTLYAVWMPNEVHYTVYRYALNDEKTAAASTLSRDDSRTARVDTYVNATEADMTFSGYHYFGNTTTEPVFNKNITQIQVNAGGTGSAAIELYFTQADDTKYTVYFWKMTGAGTREALEIANHGEAEFFGITSPAGNAFYGKGYADTIISIVDNTGFVEGGSYYYDYYN